MSRHQPALVVRQRAFSILDAMVLVAAMGLGLFWCRDHFNDALALGQRGSRHFLSVLLDFLVPLTWALAILCFRRPRPNLRRLSRRPGMIATLSASIAILLGGIDLALALLIGRMRFGDGTFEWASPMSWGDILGNGSVTTAGITVAVAWSILALSQRCRWERSWIELAGIIVGIVWVLVPGLSLVVYYLEMR